MPSVNSLLATGLNLILAKSSVGSIVLACIGLLLAMIAAFVVVVWLKRWIRGSQHNPLQAFTLDDLRRLHREGQISDEEFARAKQIVLDRLGIPPAGPAESPKPGENPGTSSSPPQT